MYKYAPLQSYRCVCLQACRIHLNQYEQLLEPLQLSDLKTWARLAHVSVTLLLIIGNRPSLLIMWTCLSCGLTETLIWELHQSLSKLVLCEKDPRDL